jgi:hypothetical protein
MFPYWLLDPYEEVVLTESCNEAERVLALVSEYIDEDMDIPSLCLDV